MRRVLFVNFLRVTHSSSNRTIGFDKLDNRVLIETFTMFSILANNRTSDCTRMDLLYEENIVNRTGCNQPLQHSLDFLNIVTGKSTTLVCDKR